MTQNELQNFQEAFVILYGFSIELALALVLMLVAFIALFWIFNIPRLRKHHGNR